MLHITFPPNCSARWVPADWQHPTHEVFDHQIGDTVERYTPLYPGEDYAPAAAKFLAKANADGLQEAVEWCGCPDQNDYMPDWPAEQRTHLMMYEDTTEGTPISPAFQTPQELAQWLVDNNATVFAEFTASYECWLQLARPAS